MKAFQPWARRQSGTRVAYGGLPIDLPPDIARRSTDPQNVLDVPDRLVLEDMVRLVRWAEINASAAGNNTILNGVGGNKITVVSIDFVVAAAVTIAWLSNASTIRNAQSFAANSGLARDLARPYYVQTNPGEALIMSLGGAVSVRGAIGYVQVQS